MSRETQIAQPSIRTEVGSEIVAGDPATWQPTNYEEWEGRERVKTYLDVWKGHMDEERKMRSLYSKLIFILVSIEVTGSFAIILGIGAGWINVDVGLLKVLFTAVFAEVFGLAYLVTKYLFSQPLRHSISELNQHEQRRNGRRQPHA